MIRQLLANASIEQLRQTASPMGVQGDEISVYVTGETQDAFFNRDVVVDIDRVVAEIKSVHELGDPFFNILGRIEVMYCIDVK